VKQAMIQKEECISDLKNRIMKSEKAYDLDAVDRAITLACCAHEGQKRASGEEYVCHPLQVACILVDLGMDDETIEAAILHDVVEDTPVELAEIRKQFGEDVANLVDGVTKLNKIPFSTREEQQAENVRKMLLAMSEDIRVIIIKLADRLHNPAHHRLAARAEAPRQGQGNDGYFAPARAPARYPRGQGGA